jgi:hypothetical protein
LATVIFVSVREKFTLSNEIGTLARTEDTMNRTASPSRSRSRRSSVKQPPAIVAKLDLEDEGQRRLHELIRRFHTGRWPLFRCLGMCMVNGVLFEAVEWLRQVRPTFSVVEYHMDGLGITFRDAKSATEAKRALDSIA